MTDDQPSPPDRNFLFYDTEDGVIYATASDYNKDRITARVGSLTTNKEWFNRGCKRKKPA